MNFHLNRRQFVRTSAAASLAALLERGAYSNTAATKKAVVHADDEIGLVRPEFH